MTRKNTSSKTSTSTMTDAVPRGRRRTAKADTSDCDPESSTVSAKSGKRRAARLRSYFYLVPIQDHDGGTSSVHIIAFMARTGSEAKRIKQHLDEHPLDCINLLDLLPTDVHYHYDREESEFLAENGIFVGAGSLFSHKALSTWQPKHELILQLCNLSAADAWAS